MICLEKCCTGDCSRRRAELGLLLVALSIVVVRSGMAGARVSEMSGTVPGTLDPGAHMVMPLVEAGDHGAIPVGCPEAGLQADGKFFFATMCCGV
jgi:hypothetical protein